jgi:hypothetical protein
MAYPIGHSSGDRCARAPLIVAAHADALRADVLIASDGPRVTPEVPTIATGTRGSHRTVTHHRRNAKARDTRTVSIDRSRRNSILLQIRNRYRTPGTGRRDPAIS